MAWLSHTTVPPSSITGTRRFGFMAPNSSVSRPPNGPPASICSRGRPNSPTAHMTFCTLIELRRPQTFSMGSGALERTAFAEQQRLAVVDHLAVDAHPADLAREAAVLDLGAAIHDDGEAGLACQRLCLFADDAELHPDHLDAQAVLFGKRLVHELWRDIGGAEDIDLFDRRC